MKNKTIPSGYCITVASWENDYDHRKSESVFGLTEVQAKMIVSLVQLFKSMHSYPNPGYGNMLYSGKRDFHKIFEQKVEELKEKYKPTEECLQIMNIDFMSGLGLYNCSDDFMTRVFESLTVEYYPEEILIQDVTDKFNV